MPNPKWVQIALAELGQAEIPGAQNNPRIVEYHQHTSLKARDDETAWCASFASFVLDEAGLASPHSARAMDFAGYGTELVQPVLGAIVVFTRTGGGHVAFYQGRDDKTGRWLMLGGNQGNKVSIAAYDPKNVVSIRWPSGVPLPNAVAPLAKSGVVWGSVAAGALSVAQVGNGLVASADSVNVARAWISDGGLVSIVLGVLALAGVVFAIYSRAKGKAAEAAAQ